MASSPWNPRQAKAPECAWRFPLTPAAAGYLLKQAAVTDLVGAIRAAKKGKAFFSPAISRRLMDHYQQTLLHGVPVRKRTRVLTSRETEVLQLIAEGKLNKQIAFELGL